MCQASLVASQMQSIRVTDTKTFILSNKPQHQVKQSLMQISSSYMLCIAIHRKPSWSAVSTVDRFCTLYLETFRALHSFQTTYHLETSGSDTQRTLSSPHTTALSIVLEIGSSENIGPRHTTALSILPKESDHIELFAL